MRVRHRPGAGEQTMSGQSLLSGIENEQIDDPATRLVLTATRLFNEHSIHSIGIDRIIAEAGVARMTLYNRFGSKEGLVRAVLERESRQWFEWVGTELHRVKDCRRKIDAYFALLGKWFSRSDFKGCAFINAVAEHDRLDVCIRPIARAHRHATLVQIRSLLNELGLCDGEELAEQLTILTDGAIVTAMVTGDGRAAAIAGKAAAGLLDAALRNSKQASPAQIPRATAVRATRSKLQKGDSRRQPLVRE